jgi:hypothetical protein
MIHGVGAAVLENGEMHLTRFRYQGPTTEAETKRYTASEVGDLADKTFYLAKDVFAHAITISAHFKSDDPSDNA